MSKQSSPVSVVEIRASESGFAILVSPLMNYQQKAIKNSKLCFRSYEIEDRLSNLVGFIASFFKE